MKLKLIISLLLLLSAYQSMACSCALGTLEERIKRSPEIFVGKVIRVEPCWQKESDYNFLYHRTIFQVEKIYKGQVFPTEIVVHDPDSGSCGISFDQDSVYLIFTEYAPWLNETSLTTGDCSGTANVNSTFGKEAIRKLDKLAGEIELITTMSADRLYNVIWKGESFFFTEEREKLLMDYLEISKLKKELLSNCVTNSDYPKSDSAGLSTWNYVPDNVYAKYEIDEKGQLSEVAIEREIDKDCQKKAVDFVKKLHPWKPATIRGIAVKSYGFYDVPFPEVKER
ncbi:hypothetical protein JKA74_00680 [Marivirga sp. S37H4]|uniref:TonB C-terminal domain-containing protein n=1 Tax=Marivirga aurantiaca TaxID=2802615 RepID=A0A935C653_9BACT|nr:hypothetical protein [Marivirga aurantiaca]MBK6263532.1 hypothetical protein [Marivirga aurantiaca]